MIELADNGAPAALIAAGIILAIAAGMVVIAVVMGGERTAAKIIGGIGMVAMFLSFLAIMPLLSLVDNPSVEEQVEQAYSVSDLSCNRISSGPYNDNNRTSACTWVRDGATEQGTLVVRNGKAGLFKEGNILPSNE